MTSECARRRVKEARLYKNVTQLIKRKPALGRWLESGIAGAVGVIRGSERVYTLVPGWSQYIVGGLGWVRSFFASGRYEYLINCHPMVMAQFGYQAPGI
jgi:hypothetical protein